MFASMQNTAHLNRNYKLDTCKYYFIVIDVINTDLSYLLYQQTVEEGHHILQGQVQMLSSAVVVI
jgi:hypothetical protein